MSNQLSQKEIYPLKYILRIDFEHINNMLKINTENTFSRIFFKFLNGISSYLS